MYKNKTIVRIFIALLIAVSVTACGQKGDLYLPEGLALFTWFS
jgi:predicted small lipoprotein YifL